VTQTANLSLDYRGAAEDTSVARVSGPSLLHWIVYGSIWQQGHLSLQIDQESPTDDGSFSLRDSSQELHGN